ncbi:UNVERIFIED_ORG: hypothetical protein M2402_000878 [Rahnella aquatilis]
MAGALLYRNFFDIEILTRSYTGARYFATQGSIMTAALADACGLFVYWCIFLTFRKQKNRISSRFCIDF